MKIILILCGIVWLVLMHEADAKTVRSAHEVVLFKKANPCPTNGRRSGPCPGQVVDHKWPLCAGGPDNHDRNMKWQPYAESLLKDAEERKLCRIVAKAPAYGNPETLCEISRARGFRFLVETNCVEVADAN